MTPTVEISGRASLVALGVRFQQMAIWPIVKAHVTIRQKVLRHRPLDKLLDCLINILAGGSGLVEINMRVRPDHALQLAFGRPACAEQSTVSETLNACTPDNVAQMRTAIKLILRRHAHCYRHNYQQDWQLLDIDMTGMPAGRLSEGVSKGYFAGERNRRGRQLGRVLASWYDEIVVDRLYDGKRQLNSSLQELLSMTEDGLELDEARRRRTIVRCDGGGGEDDDINWLLDRHYYLLVKVKNWRRATKLAASVSRWYADPKIADREVGWVETAHSYTQPTRQLALRKGKQDGTWSYHALVFNLTDEMLDRLTTESRPEDRTTEAVLFAALHAYDRRGGGVETQNRGDKQGLGLTHRNKHKFAAQEMLVLLTQLAHNLIVWTRDDLAESDPRFHKYGIQRTVRDALQIPGTIQISARGQIQGIALNERHPLTPAFCHAFAAALTGDDLSPILGEN